MLRLNVIQYHPLDFDVNRDLIIASHIAKYGEYPATGPDNSLLGFVGNSPLYYYTLASLDLISNNNSNFIIYVNLTLQVCSIVILYFVVKKIFGKSVGLIAAFLITTSNLIVIQSQFSYQPYFMFPILALSLLFLVTSYKTQKFWRFIVSIILFMVSGAMHMSAFLLFPLFVVPGFLILGKSDNKLKDYSLVFGVVIVSFLILFLGTIISNTDQIKFIFSLVQYSSIEKISNFGTNFLFVFSKYLISLLAIKNQPSLENIFVILTLIISVLAVIFKKRNSELKFLLAMFFQIIFYITFIVLFADSKDQLYRDHRFYPIFVLGLISVAFVIDNFFKNYKFGRLIEIIFVVMLAHSLLRGLPITSRVSIEEDFTANKIVRDLESQILNLEFQEKSLRFFQIRVYECHEVICQWKHYEYGDVIFWFPLEKDFGINFIKVERYLYSPINEDKYIFLTCIDHSRGHYDEDSCLSMFANDIPNYKILRKVLEEDVFHIFLAIRNNK